MKINIVVNDVMCSHKSVNTRVVITLLLHDVIHCKTVTSYDAKHYDHRCMNTFVGIHNVIDAVRNNIENVSTFKAIKSCF